MGMQAKINANHKHAAMTWMLRISRVMTERWVLMLAHCNFSHILCSVSFDGSDLVITGKDDFEVVLNYSFIVLWHSVCDVMCGIKFSYSVI